MPLDKVGTFRVDSHKWDMFVKWCGGFRVKPQDILRRLVSEIVNVELEDMIYPTDWFDLVDDEFIGPGQESYQIHGDPYTNPYTNATHRDINIDLPTDYYSNIENH